MPQEVTATNPQTGETLVLRNGAWVPADAPPEAAPTATNSAGETVVLENGEWVPLADAGDNGIYPEMRPGFSQANPIDLTAIDRSTPEGQALVAQLTRGTWVKGADGTVYALPQDAREGVVSVGDEPLSAGLVQRPFSAVEDVAKSFPTGVVEGLTGLAGMQGTIAQMAGGQPGQYMPGFGIVGPTGEQLNEGVRDLIGRDYYQPQSVAGEYSRTVGEFLPGALAPGGVGARAASVLVPAATSETAGQIARGMSGGQRDTAAEGFARLGGGLVGGLGVGGANMVRSGGDTVLRNAAEGVTPQQLQMAAALRQRGGLLGVDLTNAEALQQATGGATGLGRLQRVVEGQTARMAPTFAARPGQVQQAIANELDRIGPSVEPSALAPRVQQASAGVLNTLRRRANEDAGPFYRNLPGQSLPPEQFQQLTENPSFAAALRAVRGDEELAPLLSAELPMDQSTRMLRAEQQGFNTERPFYHGTRQPIEGEFRTDLTERGVLGEGMYVTRRPQIASEYAGQEGVVYPTFLRRGSVLDTTTPEGGAAFRAGETADIIRAPGQSVVRNPDAIRSTLDQFPAPTPDNDLNVLNETVKQLRTMADEAAPNSMRVGGSNTRAAQRSEAAALADALASEVSPDWRMARDTVRGVNEAFIDPLKAGPIGALADSSEAAPNLAAMTGRVFPDAPFEGQAAETARALELMGEIDPSVGGPLVRQHLARQAMEAQQQLATGDNQFGGANFAARAFGNPEQRRTVMGAIDATAPPPSPLTFPPLNPNAPQAMPSDPMAQLVEVLQATGQRHRGGSETAFNTEAIQNLRGGNLATNAAQTVTNPLGVFGRAGRWFDDMSARRNAESLADLLMANSDEFNARLTRAINRPRGANRIRAGATISAGQED